MNEPKAGEQAEPDESANVDHRASQDSSSRSKVLAFLLGALVLVGAGLAYLLFAVDRVDDDIASREQRALQAVEEFEEQGGISSQEALALSGAEQAASEQERLDAERSGAGPGPQPGEVLVVNRVPGEDYGRLAIRHADGTRTLLERRCERVHLAAANGLCLAVDDTVLVPAWRTEFFDASDDRLVELRSYASPRPSRARVSPDGSVISTTGFVSGQGYADIGSGTETVVTIDSFDGSNLLVSMAQFEVLGDDPSLNAEARQFWGVSFVDSTDFWVTGWFGDGPEILRGDSSRRTLETFGWDGSCPSVSPDGSTLVFKETQPDESFLLVAVDIATGRRWRLGEQRAVDDQVEWLDNDTLLYAMHTEGSDGTDAQPQFDIWSVDVAPGSTPELFLPAASSPAVAR